MINFLDLFNGVAKVARPAYAALAQAQSMDEKFADIGIDSLDGLLMIVYLTELYGIEDEVCKEWHPETVQQLYDLIMANKTKEPDSVEQALKDIQ